MNFRRGNPDFQDLAYPRKHVVAKPRSNSTLFCGEFINITHVALEAGLSVTALSYYFRGLRTPKYKHAKRIADALGMNVAVFMNALARHIETQLPYSPNPYNINPPVRQAS